jgi:hypothetical protein
LRISSFRSALLLEAVAVVPASAMLGPKSHAHPAEFVFALSAGHMVAATVLLDSGATLAPVG